MGADALDGPGAGHIEPIHDFYRTREDRQLCGTVGYVGSEQAAPILLHGLSKLEYRGYDSAGLAVRDGVKNVEIVKAKGRLKALAEKTNDGKALVGTLSLIHI